MAVVSSDVEHQLRVVPHAGDVDRDEVLADLLPLDGPAAAGGHVEHLGPQPAMVRLLVMRGSQILLDNIFKEIFRIPPSEVIEVNVKCTADNKESVHGKVQETTP